MQNVVKQKPQQSSPKEKAPIMENVSKKVQGQEG